MNKKLKAKWLKALRSGEYKQGSGQLVTADGGRFCCLGVLADIQGCEWREDVNGSGLVPLSQSGRAIVKHSDDMLPKTRAGGLSHEAQESLAHMNDGGSTFKQIAKHIETHL